jgi:hypothetical protein
VGPTIADSTGQGGGDRHPGTERQAEQSETLRTGVEVAGHVEDLNDVDDPQSGDEDGRP